MLKHHPRVSFIVPCRNEKDHIREFVNSVLSQDFPEGEIEVILADGMSDDGTREVLDGIAAKNAMIRVINNPQRTTPFALNYAIRAAAGEIIVRMDVHTEYAHDYVKQCIEALEHSGADNVGGPWHAKGKNYLQCAIALAFQSPFSSGGAGSHATGYEGAVDSVYLGCWKKTTLEKIGLFDEELVRNQDDELNLRIVRAGGKIWQSPKIKSWYYPRSSVKALFKQYMQYGYWKVRVIQKHKIPASPRHVIPILFIASLILLAIFAPFSTVAFSSFFLLISSYVFINLTATIMTCHEIRLLKYLPVMPLIFAIFHFGYGYGFLRGIIDFIILRKSGRNTFKTLTRN